ncbi:hypothetical protein N826_31205 [Skermanella aerolata KACC 11604]|nr:hypothetical protein N826_31205 [Skermanella aerolata KACC 11604]
MFRESGQHVHQELGSMGIVHDDELRTAFHQSGDESHVARQPVELGNHQHGLLTAAEIKRSGELGPVILPTAFYFGELRDQFTPARHEACHGGALSVEAKAAFAVAVG